MTTHPKKPWDKRYKRSRYEGPGTYAVCCLGDTAIYPREGQKIEDAVDEHIDRFHPPIDRRLVNEDTDEIRFGEWWGEERVK